MISYLSFLVHSVSDLFKKTHLTCRETSSFVLKVSADLSSSSSLSFLPGSDIHII